jgi:hypothetical protein
MNTDANDRITGTFFAGVGPSSLPISFQQRAA